MMIRRLYIAPLFLLFFAGNLQAQKTGVQITSSSIELQDDSVHIGFILSAAGLRTDYRMDITPILYTDTNNLYLPAARIAGKSHQRLQARKQVLQGKRSKNQDNRLAIQTTVAGEPLRYTASVAYEPWMQHASLRVDVQMKGCCRSELLPSGLVAKDIALVVPQATRPEPNIPEPVPVSLSAAELLVQTETFVCPIAEFDSDKATGMFHRDREALRVYFHQNKTVIENDYRDNAVTLERFDKALRILQGDSVARIGKILLVGCASIEGSLQHNQNLAGKRAEVLKDFAVARGVDPQRIEIVNLGEGWDELRDLIAESDSMPYRKEALRIIDTVPIMKGRELQLMKLGGGNPYRWMMKHLFPLQRNAGYIKVYYEKR